MKIIFNYCEKGDGKINEDVVGSIGNCFWVIDGATDVFFKHHLQKENEVYWYVQELDKYLKTKYLEDRSLEFNLKNAVDLLYKNIASNIPSDVPEYELPTFAIAMIKAEQALDSTKVSYYILGDCSISCIYNNKITTITDRRITEFAKLNREKLKANSLDPRTDKKAQDIYRETRKNANQKNGYPIGSVRGAGIKKGKQGEFFLSKGDKILILSDGFHDYLTSNPSCMKDFLNEQKINKAINEMNSFLQDEKEYKKTMRPKLIDDRSALLLKVDE